MGKRVRVGVSNRHVHLTEDIYNQLFTEKLEKRNDLSQIGEFASNQVVRLRTNKGVIENVRVLGPFRNYNQVEIAYSDARILGIHPPVRKSGDLVGSEDIVLETSKKSILLKEVCIRAERHVHMNREDARKFGVKNNQLVKVLIKGEKACILYARVKVSDNGFYELHLDIDDANSLGIQNKDEVEIIL